MAVAKKAQSAKKKAATKNGNKKIKTPVRVVAIGASAGGLEPIEKFFDNMPTDSGLAFVIVQHLSPDFKSMMDELIARHSNMKILHAEDQLEILPNTIYLNPPRTDLSISDGRLIAQVSSETATMNLPIDGFFKSVASELKENAIGIIFSGTGSDGTQGARGIIEAGGITIIQDPKTAKFDSMPRSAIDRGLATMVSRPEKMASIVEQLLEGTLKLSPPPEDTVATDPEDQIINLLERKYGADFGYYKYATVGRRIHRRATLNHFNSLEKYAEKVASDANELETLYHDLLIGVTSFFRDHAAFDILRDNALHDLVKLMTPSRQLRIWAPGCATGQEAYTIAIMINELAEAAGMRTNLKIFATDLHLNSLDFAQEGVYDEESIKNVPEELLEKYFTQHGDGYHVSMNIKKLVVFSQHNLLRDPPFTRIDMVCCRNVLIYFNDFVQHKVIAYFHFALNKDGILFLGPSETVAKHTDEFEVLNKRWRLYKKLHDIKLLDATTILPLSRERGEAGQLVTAQTESGRTVKSGTARSTPPERQLLIKAYDAILAKYAPTSFLIDQNRELVHVFGNSEKYIKITAGLFSRSLVDIIHPDLRLLVAAGLDHVMGRTVAEFRRTCPVKIEDDISVNVTLTVETMPLQRVNFYLVSIQEKTAPSQEMDAESDDGAPSEFYYNRIRELEVDLKSTEESLQTSIEELETSNEELQSTNEELMASNEELQSTNEELHSVNEELYTVSAEHQKKIEELVEATDDMDNLLKATDIGTIFLDENLNVRRYTPAAARAVNLIEYDLGRPFQHITYRFNYPKLFENLRHSFDDGIAFEESVEIDGRAHLLRIQPFNHRTDFRAGVVIVIIDVHELQTARDQLAVQKESYELLVEHQSNLIVSTNAALDINYANSAFLKLAEMSIDDIGALDFIGCVQETQRDEFKKAVELASKGEQTSIKIRWEPLGHQEIWIDWVIKHISEDEIQFVGTDVTTVREARLKLIELNKKLVAEEKRFRELYRRTPAMMHSIDEEGMIVEASDHWQLMLGYEPSEVIGKKSTDFLTEESAKFAREQVLPEFWRNGRVNNVPYQMIRKDGKIIDVSLSGILQTDDGVLSKRSLAVVQETTRHLAAERKLETHIHELDHANNALNEFNQIISHDLKSPLRAIQHISEWIMQDLPDSTDEKLKENVERINKQAEHMSHMLSDLLDYAAVEVQSAKLETFNLKKEIQHVVDTARLGKTAVLHFKNLPENITELKAPLLLVMRNLVENSIKHNDNEKVTILVTYAQKDGMMHFTIEDDGPGIQSSHHDTVLLPFRKMHNNNAVQGSGMGLALVKKVVELNGGNLMIDSEPDVRRGTKFVFTWKGKNTPE